jgi:hypothetical protein
VPAGSAKSGHSPAHHAYAIEGAAKRASRFDVRPGIGSVHDAHDDGTA